MSYFKNPNDPENIQIKKKILEWLKTYKNIDENSVCKIEEIPCWEPNCPDIFTKINYLNNGIDKEFIIHKPLIFVRKIDFLG